MLTSLITKGIKGLSRAVKPKRKYIKKTVIPSGQNNPGIDRYGDPIRDEFSRPIKVKPKKRSKAWFKKMKQRDKEIKKRQEEIQDQKNFEMLYSPKERKNLKLVNGKVVKKNKGGTVRGVGESLKGFGNATYSKKLY
tara:strand:+ start:43 stop:453 length:411 start_codon:yes stop_codon:yes gene_type:complete